MTDTSALLKAVEVLGPVTADEVDHDNHQVNVIVLDGMALVNKVKKTHKHKDSRRYLTKFQQFAEAGNCRL